MIMHEFLNAACQSAEARGFARLELLTGCCHCGKRLVSSNNRGDYVRPDTGIIVLQDERTGEQVAAYAICTECAMGDILICETESQ